MKSEGRRCTFHADVRYINELRAPLTASAHAESAGMRTPGEQEAYVDMFAGWMCANSHVCVTYMRNVFSHVPHTFEYLRPKELRFGVGFPAHFFNMCARVFQSRFNMCARVNTFSHTLDHV